MVNKNKKASGGVIIAIISLMFVIIGAVISLSVIFGGDSLTVNEKDDSVVSAEISAEISSISSTLGTDFEGDLDKLRIVSTDLTSSAQTVNLTLSLDRDDTFQDLTTIGQRFTVVIDGMKGYDSWNTSVSQDIYFVTYDSSSEKYTVTVAGSTNGDVDYIVSISGSLDVIVTFDMTTLANANNIVKAQYSGETILTVHVYNPAGDEVDNYEVEYFRTTATA